MDPGEAPSDTPQVPPAIDGDASATGSAATGPAQGAEPAVQGAEPAAQGAEPALATADQPIFAWEAPHPPAGGMVGFRSAMTRSIVVRVMLCLVIVADLANAVHEMSGPGLLDRYAAGAANVDDLIAFDDAMGMLGLAQSGALVLCSLAFLAWLSRVVDNVPSLGVGQPVRSPRGAILWWFVPFANLVIPYGIVADLNDRLRIPSGRDGRPLLLSWWLLWIIGNVYGYVAGLIYGSESTDTVEELSAALVRLGSSDLLDIVAAMLAIAVVTRIQRREDARAAAGPASAPTPEVAAA